MMTTLISDLHRRLIESLLPRSEREITTDRIREKCDEVAEMLVAKSAACGDSALHPRDVFSPGKASGDDLIMGLLGCLILLALTTEDEATKEHDE